MATLQSSPGVTMNLGDLTTEPGGIGGTSINIAQVLKDFANDPNQNRGIGAPFRSMYNAQREKEEQEPRKQRNTLCIVGAIVLVTVIAIIIKHKRRK